MAFFMKWTDTIGQIISQGTITTTGSVVMTLFIIMLLLIVAAVMFSIPIEWTAIIILPLMISLMQYSKEFMGIGTVLILYLSLLLAKNFLFR